jgi:MFS family permease
VADTVARAPVRALLAGNRAFRTLWTARLISFLGDSLGLIALLLYTASHFGTGLAVALLMIAGDFIPSLLSPVAGAVGDRWDRRTVLISCEFVQAGLIAVIAITLPSLPLLLLLVAVQSAVAAVFQPASRSAVPSLVPDADLERANSAIGFGTNGIDSAGPLAGAVLLAVLSVRELLMIDGATFVISAMLLTALPALALPSRHAAQSAPAKPSAAALFAQARDGLLFIWRDKVIRVITLAFCAIVLFNGVDDVALVFLARHTLHGSPSDASLVYAGAGLGLLTGFLLIARAAPRLAMPLLIVAGYTVSSLGNLLTGLSFAIVAALAFQVVRGLGIAAMDVGHNTLIQRAVPAEMLGRAFGNVYGAVGAAAGLSYVFGGLLLDATNARVTLIAAGSGGIVAAAAAAILLPRVLAARVQEPAEGK